MTPLPRITLAATTALIAFCAVTFAALRVSSPYWASAMVSLTTLVLLGSVVAAVWGRHRAGWAGFAIFGCGYFLITFTSPFRDVARPHLFTSVAIAESYRFLHPEVQLQVIDLTPLPAAGVPVEQSSLAMGGQEYNPASQFVAVAGAGPQPIFAVFYGGQNGNYVPAGPNRFYTFECSAHAAFTLVFGMLGGILGFAVARRAATGYAEIRP